MRITPSSLYFPHHAHLRKTYSYNTEVNVGAAFDLKRCCVQNEALLCEQK